jgi:hypothetical protein
MLIKNKELREGPLPLANCLLPGFKLQNQGDNHARDRETGTRRSATCVFLSSSSGAIAVHHAVSPSVIGARASVCAAKRRPTL